MILQHRCLGLISLVAVAASVACSAPTPTSTSQGQEVTSKPAKEDVVLNAPSTKPAQAKLGITRWHTIIEKKSGAVVVDGADAKGRVQFTSSFRVSKADHRLHIESYAKEKGTLVIDLETGVVVSSTMPAAWGKYASLYAADWQHHRHTVAYGFFGEAAKWLDVASYLAGGVATLAGVATALSTAGVITIPAAIPLAGITVGATAVAGLAKGLSQIATGIDKAIDLFSGSKPETAAPAAGAAQDSPTSGNGEQKATEQRAGEQSAGEQNATEQNAGEQSAGEQNATEQNATEQNATEQSAGEQSATEQNAEAQGQEQNGADAPEGQGGVEGGDIDNAGAGENPEQGSSLPEGSGENLDSGLVLGEASGGVEGASSSEAGLGESAFAAGSCRKKACSRKSTVCVCSHY